MEEKSFEIPLANPELLSTGSVVPKPPPARPQPLPSHPYDQRRVALASGFAVLWTCFILLAQFSGALDEFEEPLLDFRQKLSSYNVPPSDQLALVAIDDIPSDHPWPWPRLDYSLMLRSVIDDVPNSIVFEMSLNDRDTQYNAFDTTFAGIVNRANVVVFSGKLITTELAQPVPENITRLQFEGDIRHVSRFNSAIWPLETFAGNSPVGINNLEAEGVSSKSGLRLRRLPLVFMLKQTMLPSLTLQASAQLLGADLNASTVQLGRAIFLRRTDGKLVRTIPIDQEGRIRVRYRPSPVASWQASFNNIVVYADQLHKGQTPDKDLRALRKRQIWVGRTDAGVLEKFVTPIGDITRLEVQMQAEREILNQDYVRPLPPFFLAIFYLVVAVGGAALLIRLGWQHTLACLLILLAFWIETSLLSFRVYNIILPFFSFLLLLVGTYSGGFLALYWDLEPDGTEQKK